MAKVLLSVLILCVALVYADYSEELVKRNAFGTMRFGKRSASDLLESGEDSSNSPRLTRSGASLGTMRFGKRSMAVGEYATEEMSRDAKRSAALATMRFGRR
ncbi:flp-3 [Pristionchus pacificus]|uniref:Flp-3 n=1 Tax=Pristionchus pacificus TaxID=54126 RepID=A0A2A6B2Q5_PRIPA|nr:flp-3 [Pristionchus pacificus]|eukprot:PDM60143.1 flp-3 [Pristionchus pacificus]